MNVNAYVTDRADFKQNNIKLMGMEKAMIRHEEIIMWCRQGSESAQRFLLQDHNYENGELLIYAVPLTLIADLHIDAPLKLLPAPVTAVEQKISDSISNEISGDIIQVLRDKNIDNRSLSILSGIARKQKTTSFKQFVLNNSKKRLMEYQGCGERTIRKLEGIAKSMNLVLRES